MVNFLQACTSSKDHLEGLSSVSLGVPWIVALLRTDGAVTPPPPCSKLLAVTDTLSPCFTEKRNVEKSSITVPVSGVFSKK